MLTSDLVRVRFHKNELRLPFIDVENAEHQNMAETFLGIFENFKNCSYSELEDELKQIYSASPHNLFYRGLIKLLFDRCEFEVQSSIEPAVLREKVFLEAAKQRLVQKRISPREEILSLVAKSLEIEPTAIEEGLYADLKEQQRLLQFKPISAKQLLQRYNLALVQAVLFKATEMKVILPDLSPTRKRQLFRYMKFYQLLFTLQKNDPFEIELDGPMSLFSSCQKYGLQMALFLPAILHHSSWSIEAKLLWGKQKTIKWLKLDQSTPLQSHYQDVGIYIPPEILEFKQRFNQKYSDWQADVAETILEFADREISIPDFQFIHQKTQKKIYLEIFGYWRKHALLRRWEQIKEYLGEQLIIAVQKSLQVDEEEAKFEHIYLFRTVLIPKEIYGLLQKRLS